MGGITAKGGCRPVNQRLLVASHPKIDVFDAQFARCGSGTHCERLPFVFTISVHECAHYLITEVRIDGLTPRLRQIHRGRFVHAGRWHLKGNLGGDSMNRPPNSERPEALACRGIGSKSVRLTQYADWAIFGPPARIRKRSKSVYLAFVLNFPTK